MHEYVHTNESRIRNCRVSLMETRWAAYPRSDDATVILKRGSRVGTTHLTELADYTYLNFGVFDVPL